MYKVVLTPDAKESALLYGEGLSLRTGSLFQAEDFVREMVASLAPLSVFPHMAPTLDGEIRSLVVRVGPSYIVLYTTDDYQKIVSVLDIFPSVSNWIEDNRFTKR